MRANILMIGFVGMLAACAAPHPVDSYTSPTTGVTEKIQSNKEQCIAACNETYSSCMDSRAAQYSGVNGPSGMFGASAECKDDLRDCLPGCKAR